MPALPGFWAVIPAGGAGTRLWPLSRAGSPKFLLDLTGSGRSLLQGTLDRLAPLAGEHVLVVTGVAHQEAVRLQLPELAAGQVVAEPEPRDSMAAIALAAALIERLEPDAIMGAFAADHVITDPETFRACVRTATTAAADGWLVTIGIEPTHPATGFGYIHLGEALPQYPGVHQVSEFVEKPAADVAAGYLATGEFQWNASMWVVRAGVLLDLLAQWHPELAAGVRAIAAEPDRLTAIWPTLEKIAIDYALAEPAAAAGRVAVVPGAFGWDDIGDFASLRAVLTADRPADGTPTVLGDPSLVTAMDADGLVVAGAGRPVAVLGLSDVVVVDTADALLVTTADRAQDVKKLVDAYKAAGRTELV